MTDDNHKQAEADRPPQETVSFTFDRMTVARFRSVPLEPASLLAAPRYLASAEGGS